MKSLILKGCKIVGKGVFKGLKSVFKGFKSININIKLGNITVKKGDTNNSVIVIVSVLIFLYAFLK